jgi:two-component system LytT family response regulator
MNPLRIIIADDELLAREGLKLLLNGDPELEIVAERPDGQSTLDAIRALKPDLLFLDVQMPGLDGFEVLAALAPSERPCVVFVTAYEQYALQAFEASAVDYLLKPFSDSRFAAALAKAKDAVRRTRTGYLTQQVEQLLRYARDVDRQSSTPASGTHTVDQLVLKSEGALHFTKAAEIIWIEAQGDFVKVRTADKTQLVRETLHSFEQKLDGAKFIRIHRSFLANVDQVTRVEPALYGDYTVYMSDGTKLRLSRNYRAKLKALVAASSVS